MTKKQCKELCNDLLEGDRKYILKEIDRLITCGGVNLSKYEYDEKPFILPRILVKAALMNFVDEIVLVNPKRDMREVKNLRKF